MNNEDDLCNGCDGNGVGDDDDNEGFQGGVALLNISSTSSTESMEEEIISRFKTNNLKGRELFLPFHASKKPLSKRQLCGTGEQPVRDYIQDMILLEHLPKDIAVAPDDYTGPPEAWTRTHPPGPSVTRSPKGSTVDRGARVPCNEVTSISIHSVPRGEAQRRSHQVNSRPQWQPPCDCSQSNPEGGPLVSRADSSEPRTPRTYPYYTKCSSQTRSCYVVRATLTFCKRTRTRSCYFILATTTFANVRGVVLACSCYVVLANITATLK